jgi:hypothetical protein
MPKRTLTNFSACEKFVECSNLDSLASNRAAVGKTKKSRNVIVAQPAQMHRKISLWRAKEATANTLAELTRGVESIGPAEGGNTLGAIYGGKLSAMERQPN